MIDIFQLPKNYRFNFESLTEGKYIDDNSLYVYQSLARGRFSSVDSAMNFLFFKPFERSYTDFVSFLLIVSREYNFQIRDIKTNFSAIEKDQMRYVEKNFIKQADPFDYLEK